MAFKKLPFFKHVNWSPDREELRKFAVSMLVGFALIGLLFAVRHGHVGAHTLVLWTIGGGLAVAALVPGLGRIAYLAVYIPTSILGYVVSHLLLTTLFFALFTPLALLLRATGKDLLRLQPGAASASWLPRSAPPERRSYYRTF